MRGFRVYSDLFENLFSCGKRHRRTRSSHARKKTCDTRALGAHTVPEIIALITCAQTPFSFWSGESPFTILRYTSSSLGQTSNFL